MFDKTEMGKSPLVWDSHAVEYARMMKDGPMITPIRVMLKDMDSAWPIERAQGIMDVGCGPGPATDELLKHYGSKIPSAARLVASDFSVGMLEQVRQLKVKEAGISAWDRLETHVWDVQELKEVPDQSFSHVMGSLVFFMVPQPRKALSEVRRVLKEDGVIALTSWSMVEWMDVFEAASKATRPDLAATMGSFELPIAWSTVENVKIELEATGYRNVQAKHVATFLPADDPIYLAKWCIRSKNPGFARFIQGFSEEDLERLCLQFENIVNEKCPGSSKRLEGVAIAATGTK